MQDFLNGGIEISPNKVKLKYISKPDQDLTEECKL